MKIRKSFRLLGLSLTIAALSIGSALAKQGGISGGGGGGVAPVDPAGPALIEQALREAPLALSLYFNFRETAELQGPTPLGKILFNGPLKIQALLKNALIETISGCRDPQGKKRDGAAPGKRPQSICMDVKSLGRKLTEDNYWAQTIALAGHELSHLLGTDEQEAGELQSDILAKLRFNPSIKAAAVRLDYFNKLSDLSREVSKAASEAEGRSLKEISGIWAGTAYQGDFLHGRNNIGQDGLQLPSPDAFWLGRAIAWKLQLLNSGLYLQLGNSSPSWQKEIDRGFENGNSVTLGDLARRWTGKRVPPALSEILIERMTVPGGYEREVASILELLNRVDALARTGPNAWTALIEKDYEKPGKNAVRWETPSASLSANDFSIEVDGKKLGLALSSLSIGTSSSSIEANWQENGVEMRLHIYLRSNGTEWYSDEIRTYDGSKEGNWIYYYGDYFRTPLGQEFKGDVTLSGWNEGKQVGVLRFKDLRLKYEPKQD